MNKQKTLFSSPFRRVHRSRRRTRLDGLRTRKKRRAKQIRKALRRAGRTGKWFLCSPGTHDKQFHRRPRVFPFNACFVQERTNDMPSETHGFSPPPGGRSSSLPPTDPLELLRTARQARRDTDAKTPVWSETELKRIWKSSSDW